MNGKIILSITACSLLAASAAIGYAQTPRDYGYGRQGNHDDTRIGDRDGDRMGQKEGERRDGDDMRSGDRDDTRGRALGTEGMTGDRDRR